MRSLILATLLLLPLSTVRAQSTGMGWWNNSGDSTVLGGVTVTLTGTDIQKDGGTLHDPAGTGDASFHFTFNPPVASLQLWFEDVDFDESMWFGNPLPDHVAWLELDPEGSPIHTVRGFFTAQAGTGTVRWDGPNISSVDFSMSHSGGSIRLRQIDLDPFPYAFRAGIDLRAFPYASPAGITLEIAIADPPSGYGGFGFAVERQAMYPCDGQTTVVATFPRAPGTVRHVRFTDATVESGTSYRYRAVPAPGGSPGDTPYDFLQLFDPTGWAFEIETFATTATPVMPMILGHGKLVSFEPTAAVLESCSDSCLRPVSGFFSPAVQPYVDTGVDVVVTGSMSYVGNSYGTIAHFDTAVPTPCTVAVETSTWTNMKSLYR